MSDSIIKVKELGKRYVISHEGKESYTALRDVIGRKAKKILKRQTSLTKEEFWALKDINFEIKQGEAVGIIGRNGAGKSTLLKILSRITEPTNGHIEINGRVASLLEVGTGFHPELTGRENIFLNGAILGMSRGEIRRKFDEIVNFSGVDKFLDTPVKRYSSGMYVRLAFAVAAHLEPEILVIDEVLAVGDAEFQKKCLGKMDEVSKSGRTVLFVSHNMTAVQTLCPLSLMLINGTTTGIKNTNEVISLYYSISTNKNTDIDSLSKSNKKAGIISARILNDEGKEVNKIYTYNDFYLEIRWFNKSCEKVNVAIELHNYSGRAIMFSADVNEDWYGIKKKKDKEYISRVKILGNWLRGDEYFIRPCLLSSDPDELIDVIIDGVHLSIIDPADEKTIARGNFKHKFDAFTHFTSLEWVNTEV